MKIIHVSNGQVPILASGGGGSEKYILSIAKYQAKLGHDVVIYDRRDSRDEPAVLKHDNVTMVRIRVPRLPAVFERNPVLFSALYRIRNLLDVFLFGLFVRTLALRRSRFDAVHFHDVVVGLALLPLNPKARSKSFYTQHGVSFQEPPTNSITSFYRNLRIYVMKHSRVVIALNPSAQKQFIAETGYTSERIKLIPTGIDTAELRMSDDRHFANKSSGNRRIVLYVGRITEQKGIETLIRAAEILQHDAKYSDVFYALVGPMEQFDTSATTSEYSRRLSGLIDRFNLHGSVKFLGRLSSQEVEDLFYACSMFVLPSLIENMPLVLCEAMASKKPVVASRLPGTSMQVLDGWNGYLFRPGDQNELAEKIRLVLDNPERAEQMGVNGRARVLENFDMKNIAMRICESYSDGISSST